MFIFIFILILQYNIVIMVNAKVCLYDSTRSIRHVGIYFKAY